MRMYDRGMTSVRSAALAALAALACACGDSGSSGTGTASATITSATTSTTEPQACPGLDACNAAQDCCDTDCPSQYPHKWSCVDSKCVHACESNSDCTALIPGLVCIEVDGVGHCVTPCVDTADCDGRHMEKTTCQAAGDTGAKFCLGDVAS